MFQKTSYFEKLTFFEKIKSLDFILIFCILILGIVSSLAMYSTDGGELLYHSKSHIIRFIVFFLMMLILSFVRINFWHSIGYFLYIVIFASLLWASFYGITASGSQRWISLYFINLQPSELMKVTK